MNDFKVLFPELTDGQLAQLRRLIAEEVIGAKLSETVWANEAYWKGQEALRVQQLAKLNELIGGEKS